MLNNKFILFAVIALFSLGCQKKNLKAGLEKISDFGDNPGKLRAFYHEPENPTENMPLMVVLHGCNQRAREAADLTDWNNLADIYGFYVLYPEQKTTNNGSRCFNWFLEKDYTKNSGENESIKNMILTVQNDFKLDPSRTYITGLSAGAAMSMIMIADYPEMFDGAAIMSGGPFKSAGKVKESYNALAGKIDKTPQEWGDLVREENPKYSGDYPPIMVFHGKKDLVVDFKNSNEIIEQWSNVLGISLDNKTTTNPETDITRIAYLDDLQSEVIVSIEVDKMGHALLVDPGNEIDQGGGKGVFAEDINYFSSYWVGKQFGLIP